MNHGRLFGKTVAVNNLLLALLVVAHLAEISLVALLTGDVTWWRPACALPSLQIWKTVHQVDVFKAQSLGLVEEAPGYDGRDEVHSSKDVSKGVRDTVVSEGGEETDEDYLKLALLL